MSPESSAGRRRIESATVYSCESLPLIRPDDDILSVARYGGSLTGRKKKLLNTGVDEL